jgi:hypothetical protein
MAKLGDLIVRVGVDTRGLNDKLGNVKKQMRQTTGQLTQMGKSLSMSLTAPLLGIGALAVKAATDFEFSMAKVQAVSGFTAAEMGRLETQAQELGASTSKSASDVGQLQLELAKLGKTSTEIEQMTEGVLSLSIAFDTELGETARVVGATLNQFGLEASESGRIVDNMAVLFGSSALDLEKFDTAMRTVGPTASAMGLSVEEAGAALGILVNAGVDASTAGTALTKSLTTLAQEGMTGAEAIEFLTTNNLSVADAFEKFGDRAGKIIPILKGTTGAFQDLTQKQIEGTGAALKARKILEDTAQGGFDKLRSAVEALGISLGDALLPMVKQMTDALAGFASRLAGMSDEAKTATLLFGGFLAAIGPALIVLPNLVNGLKLMRTAQMALNKAVLANPYVAAAVAVVALSAAIYIFATRATEAEKIQKKLAQVSKNIETSYAKEASSMEFLRFQYKEAGDDLEKRKDLLDQIAVISPETVKDLDAETLSYDDLSKAIDTYLVTLKNKISTQMAEQEITSALEDQIRLEQEQNKLTEEHSRLLFEQEAASARYNEARLEGGMIAKARAQNEIESARKAMELQSSNEDAQNANNKALEANAKLIEDITKKYDTNSSAADGNAASSAAVVVGLDEVGNSAVVATVKVEQATETLGMLMNRLDETTVDPIELIDAKALGGLINMLEETEVAAHNTGEAFKGLWEGAKSDFMKSVAMAQEFGNMLGSAFGSIVGKSLEIKEALQNGLISPLEAMEAKSENAKNAIKSLVISAIRALINMAKMNVIANATSPANAANLATGGLATPAFIVAGLSMLEGFLGGMTSFADGGIVSGPTMGLVGEYPGAKTNPEVIAPLDKLRSMMGGQSVVVTGKISGRDILLTSERNAIDRNRVRGF